MKIYAIVESGGEGPIRAFKDMHTARLTAAKTKDASVLEKPCASDADFQGGATGVPACGHVAGSPTKVWLVVCGDRGCTNGFLSAHATQAEAKAAAAAADEAGKSMFGFYDVECTVE